MPQARAQTWILFAVFSSCERAALESRRAAQRERPPEPERAAQQIVGHKRRKSSLPRRWRAVFAKLPCNAGSGSESRPSPPEDATDDKAAGKPASNKTPCPRRAGGEGRTLPKPIRG